MINAPVFHVNGDDPEACIGVAQLAYEYRRTFNKDIITSLACCRRRGHSEGDGPSITQPLTYDTISKKKSLRELYTEALVGRGDTTMDEAEQALADYRSQLESNFAEVKGASSSDPSYTRAPDYPVKPEAPASGVMTAVTPETLKTIADSYTNMPDGFTVHSKVRSEERRVGKG